MVSAADKKVIRVSPSFTCFVAGIGIARFLGQCEDISWTIGHLQVGRWAIYKLDDGPFFSDPTLFVLREYL